MNELQRMQYLEAMGADMFVPRFVLSHAPVPRRAELPQSVEMVGTAFAGGPAINEEHEQRVLPEQAAAVNRIVNLDFQAESRRQTDDCEAEKPVFPPKPISESPPAKETARFSLALWRINNDVLVVDSRRPKAALPTETLLSNILFQLNLLRQPLPRAEFLNWPMAGGNDQGWDAASEMARAFLEGRLLSNPVRYMIIMGSDAGRAILQQDTLDPVGEKVRMEAFAVDALVLPSLADILYQPELKKRIWQSLQVFFNPAFTSTL